MGVNDHQEVDPMPKRWDDGMTEEEKERRRERSRAWKQQNGDRHEANNKAYRRRHRERQRARGQVTVAVRLGLLVRGACERCGAAEVEAHHDDYGKPLKVRWLCRKHHNEADIERRKWAA
jgi:ribosomal protein S27AE